MYVVIKVRVEGGAVQNVSTFRHLYEDEVVDPATDVMADDVAVVACTAVEQMRRARR